MTPNFLWRDRDFVLYWLASTVSVAGTIITSVVLPILVFQLTGSALNTALIAAFNVVPYVAFGLFAGALADRVNRRALMVACDLINTLLLASIPLATKFNVLTLPHIYAVALLSATAFVWFDAANFGALTTLVGRERVLEANSAIWAAQTIAGVLGPAAGGWLAANLGAANTLALDAGSYLFSAIALMLIARAFNAIRAPQAVSTSLARRTFTDIAEGLRFIWQHPLIRPLTLLGFGVSFTGGAVNGLIVVFGVRALGLANDDVRLGWLFTASALGALLASVSLPRLKRKFSVGRITLLGLLANLGLLLFFGRALELWSALALYGLWEAAHTLIIINGISLRQMVTPENLQGRVNASARLIAWGGSPFGAAVGGVLAEMFDIRMVYLLMMAGVLVSAVLGWLSPLRLAETSTLPETPSPR